MSNDALVPAEVDDDLEEQILKYRLQGLTSSQIARRMMLSVGEVHRALDAILPKKTSFSDSLEVAVAEIVEETGSRSVLANQSFSDSGLSSVSGGTGVDGFSS